jgi:hypothetical protein
MIIRIGFVLAALALLSDWAFAQEPPPAPEASSDAELAKKLANPVAHLISVPFQLNYDCCAGVDPDDDGRYTLNVQPVVPITLNNNLNLIIRTILPINYREGSSAIDGEGFGLGDTTQSFFFSPPSKDGFTWAAGPAFLWPTGSEGYESGKWGAGPTVLLLKQDGPLTYGILANHIWSVAGAENRPDISSTFLQPFYNYTWPDSTGLIVNTETSYDWERDQWTVPLHVGVSHMYNISGQRISLAAQGRVYLERPDDGPDWGLRFVATLLFPK